MNSSPVSRAHQKAYDAVVVGSGPNGLSAAAVMARAGRSVLVIEARDQIGGGTRTAELTLPGFFHDVCASVLPLGASSPFFKELSLEKFGLEWVSSPAALAHPLDDGSSVLVEGSVAATAAGLGVDEGGYRRLFETVARDWPLVAEDLLGPVPLPPRHPLADLRFGIPALLPSTWLARLAFRGGRARALFAGMAAHSILPLDLPVTSAFALAMTAMAHTSGWPVVRGGTGCLNGALQGYLFSLGVEFATGWEVQSLAELPKARTVLLDLAPRAIARIAREELPAAYRCRLEKFRYGPGVFKVDWALDAPIPWQAADCRKAATLHLGGAFEEILTSEAEIARGGHPRRPYVILAQPSLFDPSRAPTGKHTAWAYCHVPNGSTLDMTDRIEAQVERFAPGFRQRILARHTTNTREMEHYNPNYVGGDINAGRQDLAQFFTRPVPRWTPYSTPVKGLYICSSSTPPGGGVHGMCGYHAARAALKSDP